MSNELTPYNVLRYRVHQASLAIHDIKLTPTDGENMLIISPKSARWKAYQGLKREASVWLTALKLWKVMETNADEKVTIDQWLGQWNYQSTFLYWHVLTPHMKGRPKLIPSRAKDEPAIIKEALSRLRRLYDQLQHGGVKKVRCYMKHSLDGEGKHQWSLATDVTRIPKDFSKIEASIVAMREIKPKEAQHA